jgi:hypothetical protein
VTTTNADPFSSAGPHGDEDSDGIRRDRWGRYLLPNPETGEEQSWQRATTFAKLASDTFLLDRWGLRMALKGLMSRADLQAAVASTPLTEKRKLNEIAEQCKDAMASGARARLGTALHKFTEDVDRGLGITAPDPWRDDVVAYTKRMNTSGLTVLPEYVERICIVPELDVAGTFDRLFRLSRPIAIPGTSITLPKGMMVVGDLKTGEDLSYGWQEISIQLALYAHATHLYNRETHELEPMPEVSRSWAVIMHLPVGEEKCELYWLDIASGWRGAQVCRYVKRWRAVDGLAIRFA